MSTVEETPGEGAGGCLLRLFWMIAGNLMLVLALVAIAQRTSPGLSWVDIAFWAAVVAVLAARWVDITRFHGRNSDGQPATLADWRRHAVGLLAVAAIAYAIARLVW